MQKLERISIAFVVGTMARGGAERQMYYMCRSLCSSGHEVRIISLTLGEFWEEELKKLGVSVIWFGRSLSRVKRVYSLYKHIKEFSPDIIQSSHFFTNLYSSLVGRFLGIPSIAAVRSNFFREIKYFGKYKSTISLKMSSLIISNSRSAIRNGKTIINDKKWFYVPNIVDIEHFAPKKKNLSKDIKLLIVGSLTKPKRIDRFIDIISALLKNKISQNIDIQGYIAGSERVTDKETSFSLSQHIAQLGLDESAISFLGAVDNIADLYHNSDILIVTSEYEGMPNCVLEAMACGLPVVSTAVGEIPEIIVHGESGFLVDPYNKEQFIEYILDLINSPNKREEFGKLGRTIITKNHVYQYSEFLNNIYNLVLTK